MRGVRRSCKAVRGVLVRGRKGELGLRGELARKYCEMVWGLECSGVERKVMKIVPETFEVVQASLIFKRCLDYADSNVEFVITYNKTIHA